jgi:four helix bundle protein
MKKDRKKFKREFKDKIYAWILNLLKFIEGLPKHSISRILGNQLIKSDTSILANYVEAHFSNSKKRLRPLFPNCFAISK